MLKRLRYRLLITIICMWGFTLTQCNDKDFVTLEDRCKNFEINDNTGIGSVRQKEFQRKKPSFSEIDPNKVLFLWSEGNDQSLISYNIENQQDSLVLANSKIVSQPNWGVPNMIVYSGLDLKIHIIEDGKDKVITTDFESLDPQFYNDSVIVFRVGAETQKGASGLKFIDLNGNRIDSIQPEEYNSAFGVFDVSSEGKKIAAVMNPNDEYGLYLIDPKSRKLTKLFSDEFEGRSKIEDVCWARDESYIYYTTYRTGIFRVNVNTHDVKCIRKGCDMRSYRTLSICPDGTRIVVERVDASEFNSESGSWTEESKIVIMELNGTNETLVL